MEQQDAAPLKLVSRALEDVCCLRACASSCQPHCSCVRMPAGAVCGQQGRCSCWHPVWMLHAAGGCTHYRQGAGSGCARDAAAYVVAVSLAALSLTSQARLAELDWADLHRLLRGCVAAGLGDAMSQLWCAAVLRRAQDLRPGGGVRGAASGHLLGAAGLLGLLQEVDERSSTQQ